MKRFKIIHTKFRNYFSNPVLKIISISFLFLLQTSIQSQNLLNGPNDIVFDSLNNRYLVANWAGNSIVAIDSLGNQSYFKTNVSHAHGMEIKDSVLFVASFHNLLLINLSSTAIIANIYVPESEYLGHIALDSLNFVYITDWSSKKLFRVNLSNQTSTTLHTFTPRPVGISYEENNNRLIVLPLIANAPILAYNLTGGSIDTVRNTNIDEPDAICRDLSGNYYMTSFAGNVVYRFDTEFSSDPEIISTGHSQPSGIGYNESDNILGVTNYNINRVDFIDLGPNNLEFGTNNSPNDFCLYQNYPNPFNPVTKIKYRAPELSFVTLKVYDFLGNELATLVNEKKPAGEYEINFNGSHLTSGIYFYRLQTENFSTVKKMTLLK